MVREAYAKINISLDITGQRDDGYHLVDMIMQTVELHDTMEITRTEGAEKDGFSVSLELVPDKPGAVPPGDDNLVIRAIRLLADEFALAGQFRAKLTKRIPVAAGMAGGSTDAAAALMLVRDLCGLALSNADRCERGVKLGADVPYCILGGTMRARGIGEILTPLPSAGGMELVIVKPDIGISTPWCYREYDRMAAEPGMSGIRRPDTEMLTGLLRAGDLSQLLLRTENVLEPVSSGAHPVIGRIRGILEEQGAYRAMMTGSGPTVFAAFGGEEAADRAAAAVSRLPEAEQWQVIRTRTFPE